MTEASGKYLRKFEFFVTPTLGASEVGLVRAWLDQLDPRHPHVTATESYVDGFTTVAHLAYTYIYLYIAI